MHLAFKRSTGAQLACKIIDLRADDPRVVDLPEDGYSCRKKDHGEPLTSLEREIKILASLNHVRCIVRVATVQINIDAEKHPWARACYNFSGHSVR